jgi:hypothetical protein
LHQLHERSLRFSLEPWMVFIISFQSKPHRPDWPPFDFTPDHFSTFQFSEYEHQLIHHSLIPTSVQSALANPSSFVQASPGTTTILPISSHLLDSVTSPFWCSIYSI